MDATLGPYRILKPLGAGGMGEVYLAEDTRLMRRVALKILPARLAADPASLSRFEREARALAALNHPNIVTIYSVESAGERRFLTMEFVGGKTLAQLIPAGGMALAPLLAVAVPLADALATAHRQGIVHRDLKPANIMVSDEGRLKVLDFGLARLESEDAAASEQSTVDLVTRAGQVLGTCAYMSPEQAAGLALDARSDIFSLGTILFEMATGQRPFHGATAIDVLAAIRRDQPPPVSHVRPVMPEAVDRLVERCLEKEADRRVQTARDVVNELEAIKKAADSGAGAAEQRTGDRPGARERRVAVLPFANMSPDPQQEYFCDGMAEDLINALAHVDGLQVAARTSAFAFKGQNRDVREIGRLLDVGSVLEGSVQRAGNRLRITAQLVRVADGMHLWSERFDRQLDDIFAIQDEISLTIVDRLRVQLLPGEHARVVRRHTVDPAAHDLYVKGRFLFARRSEGDIAGAMACYEQARAQDAEYALPYVGLADALLVLGQWGWLRPREAFPRARVELERALALDSTLAEAHASFGYLAAIYDWDWAASEAHFTRALALNPRYPLTHHWYAALLCLRERFTEAIGESRRYLEFEPLSPIANTHAGQVLVHAGRFAEALEQLTKAVELDPFIPATYFWLQLANMGIGRLQDALDTGEKLQRTFGGRTPMWQPVALAAAGRMDEGRRQMAEMEQVERGGYVSHCAAAVAHAAVGNTEAAIERLERAFEERDPQLPFIRILPFGPGWERLLADARVQALMTRMGLSTGPRPAPIGP